jgi:riboflavin kinase / FMN adenylyltransferase
MQTFFGLPDHPIEQRAHLTIGNFDGVHRGHQMLIERMVRAARAEGSLAGLLTFHPHPMAVLRPQVPLAYLTTPEERAELLAALGLDFVLVLPFTRETAALSASDFMQQLTARVRVDTLWIGPDFALGRDRGGNAQMLASLGRQLGYHLHVLPPFDRQGEPVRSSLIRTLLAEEGAVDQAAELLGRPFRVQGVVQPGAQRGRKLGFPTANVALESGRLAPAHGVYACWAWRGSRGYPSVVNVGVRPTFDNGRPSMEAYLLDFSDDLYGETLGLSFIRRLRAERRFEDIQALKSQITADAEAARQILADPPDHSGARTTDRWQELRHTADWAIHVHGSTQRELFARAAVAMYALQGADPARPATLARATNLSSASAPELLVAWLNQLLLHQDTDDEMYTRFEMHEISEYGLRGIACGYRGSPYHTAIKAVTYYDLGVAETADGWSATVTFDV